jgi:hypothetical protein
MRIDESARGMRARSSSRRVSRAAGARRGAREAFRDDTAVRWLLASNQPSIGYRALVDLLDRPENDAEAVAARRQIPKTGWARDLFSRQKRGGHWESPDDLYRPKYRATIWNVQVLALLGVTRDDPRMAAACGLFLEQYGRPDGGLDTAPNPADPSELCVTGNLTRTLLLAGYGDDPRVRAAVDWIVRNQLADGGWHCWPNRAFRRGTLDAWEGLAALATIPPGERPAAARRALERGAEFYLQHRLMHQGRATYAPWQRLHFPTHYYYDVLVGLDLLTGLGYGGDSRLDPALALLERKRRSDGTWALDRAHPDLGAGAGYSFRVRPRPLVLETAGRPSLWATLVALRVRRRAARARGEAIP